MADKTHSSSLEYMLISQDILSHLNGGLGQSERSWTDQSPVSLQVRRPIKLDEMTAQKLALRKRVFSNSGVSEVIGPLPQIAPKKQWVASLWHSGCGRR
jgi:hypothetical protein